jgi:SAM-dependent methyltransferase
LHLQCASGEESLSWAVLGAKVTGVDIADRLIDIARRKAEAAGLAVRFVAADVGRLPADLGSGRFDVTYTGGGVLPWIPDIEIWARNVAGSLRPAGTFVLYEAHPVTACLEGTDSGITVAGDYFGRNARPETDTGWRHFPGGETATSTKVQFVWPLGDVITALITAGLVIERVSEYPGVPAWRFGDHQHEAERLPGSFLLLARKA